MTSDQSARLADPIVAQREEPHIGAVIEPTCLQCGPVVRDTSTPAPGTRTGWNSVWEEEIYSRGRHLNRYPYDSVVAFIGRRFGLVPDRSVVKVLEVGCGVGNNLWFARREGFQVAGIDGSTTAIQRARGRFEAEGLVGDLRVGDFAALPWVGETFDAVIDRNAITCNRRDTVVAVLDEVLRVLRPGGFFFSTIYSDTHPDIPFGRPLGDNTYDSFEAGLFRGLGTTFFASRSDIHFLYGSRFYLEALTLVRSEDFLGEARPQDALWKVECRKR